MAPRPPRIPPAQERGFSLVEVLIALAIVGLAAGMIMINTGGVTERERLQSAARELAGMSDFVRSNAAASQRTHFLQIDFDRHVYRFRSEPFRDDRGRFIDVKEKRPLTEEEVEEWRASFEWENLPRGVYFERIFISEKLYFDKGIVDVEYYPNGSLQSYILRLERRGEDRDERMGYSVIVNGLTGKAEVREGYVGFPEATATSFSSVMGEAPGSERAR